ncbi:MAG: integrase arm-type DNA-binding domain-containing protein [Rhodoferax sp.]|uniref:tyrosine-type recombinase/integrase n=1 Tax=Rhodoferax sp. TaxID=50421 RepID=UPI00263834F9|nr:integrase arm-type DNA-binding domain-containing protein [Rhodoferax sp.]MDD2883277.1 integrase arm-type DNA-binding domain-containing protein [Rhodoferax sp.]
MALTDTFVKNVKHTGSAAGDKHADGGNMYLLVNAGGKYWRLNYRFDGKQKTLALGVYPSISLVDARQRREAARKQLAHGIDPGAVKQAAKEAQAAVLATTFEKVALDWLDKTRAVRGTSTQAKTTTWLQKDMFPYIGQMPMSTIGPRDVLGALRHMEARGALDAVQRLKQICGRVFRYAVATGSAERDVTQDLKGALTTATPKHFAAITGPKEAGALMRAIYSYSGHPQVIAGLKLSAMLFVRPGELRSMEWAEIDLDSAEWRIPGIKMKMKVDHLVPLSTQALEIIQSMKPITGARRYVFPSMGRSEDRPMSENTINSALHAMGIPREAHTAHGFRAMARTIMDEVLDERVDLIEHQLAHAVKDPNGRAYNRTAHLPARRAMMQRWADYLDKLRIGTDVIPLRTGTQ